MERLRIPFSPNELAAKLREYADSIESGQIHAVLELKTDDLPYQRAGTRRAQKYQTILIEIGDCGL